MTLTLTQEQMLDIIIRINELILIARGDDNSNIHIVERLFDLKSVFSQE